MTLPAPRLDDRTFQDLVDEAKRHVRATFPDWTDHNVSDPGVTLIETFALMVDQLLYRLNRVPDRHYLKFLELLGVQLLPPSAAAGAVTFWLSAAQEAPVVVRAGTQVATGRTDVEPAVVFTTGHELVIPPCRLAALVTAPAGGAVQDRTAELDAVMARGPAAERPAAGSAGNLPVPVFAAVPQVGDAFLVGLSLATPRCAVRLEVEGPVRGINIDPDRPPLEWEAWTAAGWRDCELDHDDTKGFNRAGDILLHVPEGHEESVQGGVRAAWLRCRVTNATPGYTTTPALASLRASTIGGTASVMHCEEVTDDVLGTADGSPADRFRVSRPPVVLPDTFELVISPRGGEPEPWQLVPTFAGSSPTDRHARLDPVTGEIELGPLVRSGDGRAAQYGAVPGMGAVVTARRYNTGGGRRGNVGPGLIRVLKTSVPYIHAVVNRAPTTGGSEPETIDEARLRGPRELRAGGRAVTADDFEELARAASTGIARVRCEPVEGQALGVRLLVVPFVPAQNSAGGLSYEDLSRPSPALLQAVADRLDAQRLVGTRVLVAPPAYVGVTVVARLVARRGAQAGQVRAAAVQRVNAYLSPFDGGPDGKGWAFGRPVSDFEISAVLAALPGVDLVEEVILFPADPATGRRGEPAPRIAVPPDALVHSFNPQVRVEDGDA